MAIRETIEFDVDGRSQLKSVAGELDRIARALRVINGEGRSSGAALSKQEMRMAEIRAKSDAKIRESQIKSALRLNELEKRQTGDLISNLAKTRAAGEEQRATVAAKAEAAALNRKATKSEKEHQKSVEARAKSEKKAQAAKAAQTSKNEDEPGLLKGMLTASAVEAAARKAAELLAAGARAVFQAQAFREDVSEGLATILKSKSQADAVMKQAAETADYIGQTRAEVSGAMLQLLSKGFSRQRSDEIVRRLADLSTVDPTADFGRLQKSITDISSKGRLQGQELLQLAEAGLETTSVYDELAKTLKKTRPEIIKMQEAGKISSDVAIRAILDAIATQTGGKAAGEVSKEKSMRDLSGLMRRLENIPQDVLFDIQVGPGVDGVKGVMREIIEFFDAGTESGKEVRAVLGDAINALVEGLTGADLKKKGGTKEALQGIVETLRNSTPMIKQWGENIHSIASGVGFLLSAVGKVSGALTAWGKFWGIDFSAKSTALAYVLGPIYAIGLAIRKIGLEFFPSTWAAGAAIIDGLVAGITNKASAVYAAVSGAVSTAITGAKKLLGIASPSRVFAEMGRMVPLGMGLGIGQTAGRAEAAAASMASRVIGGASGFGGPANGNAKASPVVQGAAAGAAAATAGAGRPSVNITIENLTLGPGVPEEHADRFFERLKELLPSVLAEVA